ncbi:hypothetical protein CQW23_08508 [Capsicum baccatum]|uniref:Uncharacterized protein n=1 Tax=Capsicum baccatum TaxID=33114 RepID=A0A2G2X967_CAPBA|nr:hypothetical protein CQW23_08508 [Capsicum baccatum]
MSRFSPLARRGTIAPYLWKLPTGKMHGGATRWYRVVTFDEIWKPGATRYNCVALLKIDKCELGPWRDAPISRSLIEIGQLGIGSPLRRGLVNYCVPAGEAHLKALELARDINQKVRLLPSPLHSRSIGNNSSTSFEVVHGLCVPYPPPFCENKLGMLLFSSTAGSFPKSFDLLFGFPALIFKSGGE